MEFSVLMSVYYKDKANQLAQAIESIINQTTPPTEIVLVKDGILNPMSDAVISDYSSRYPSLFKVIALEENVGLGEALRIGLEECSYELVARMDSDDVSVRDRFEQQLVEFQNDPELDICGGGIDEFEDTIDKPIAIKLLPETHREIVSYSKKKCPVNHVTVMFRKSMIIKAGSYRTWFYNEDYDLWIRTLGQGAKFHNIRNILVHVRIDSDTYKRRGGWNYFKSEVGIQYLMLRNELISPFRYAYNILLRLGLQVVLPNSLRALIYIKLLREQA